MSRKSIDIDTNELSRAGFTLIRNLLQGREKGGESAALELADALHNLPSPGNEFLDNLTRERLREFIAKHPHLAPTIKKAIAL